MPRFLTALALVVTLAGAAAAEPRVEVLDYGVYTMRVTGKEPLPSSVSGTLHTVTNVELKDKTRTVVGRLGETFGFRYRLHGLPPGARIVVRTVHPRIVHPETGRSGTGSTQEKAASGLAEPDFTGYGFDDTYEIAEGEWRFEIEHQGRVIAVERFNVVVPIN
jgi:hypothetical protein